MDKFPPWAERLLQKRETAGLLVGLITLGVALLPLNLFAMAVALLSYGVGYELELITKRRDLRWVTLFAFLFALQSIYLGLAVAFVAALIYGYLEVLKRGFYSHATYEAFTTAFISAVYGGVSLYALVYLKSHGTPLLLSLLLTIWATDTLSYYAGKKFGKVHPLKLLSPKKTLEGFIGGLVGGVLVGVVSSLLLGVKGLHPLAWVLIVPLAVAGDLFESFLKRSYGVKDSSTLLGSHGGLLDRFDALILAAVGTAGLFTPP